MPPHAQGTAGPEPDPPEVVEVDEGSKGIVHAPDSHPQGLQAHVIVPVDQVATEIIPVAIKLAAPHPEEESQHGEARGRSCCMLPSPTACGCPRR